MSRLNARRSSGSHWCCKVVVLLGPIRAAFTRPWRRPIYILTGSPAFRSERLIRHPPEKRVERLREFWETVSNSPVGIPYFPDLKLENDLAHSILNQLRSWNPLLFGAPSFFKVRLPPPYLYPSMRPATLSYYDTTPLKATLERLVDFDRINTGATRFSVGPVNIRSGNFVYFDNATDQIGP